MEHNKLLQRQINKYLTPEQTKDLGIQKFISAINNSYIAFERDRDLMNHAFVESEKEYHEVNNSLTEEYELKKQSIANLYFSISALENSSEDTFENVKNESDELLFISKYLKEQIGKRKEIENNLSTTVTLLKTLLANLQSGILVEDENRKILFTNQLFCDTFSIPFSPEEMVGLDCSNSAEESAIHFKKSELFAPRIESILTDKKIVINELLETTDNRFLERDYIPIYIDNQYKGHLWKYNDVTQRIKTKNLLEQSKERNRLIMNSSLNAIITIDTKDRITFWNEQAETIFGWKKEEILGKTLVETIIPKQHTKSHSRSMQYYLTTGKSSILNKQLELPALHKKGHEFPIEISIISINHNGENFFCSFIQDISERKKAENNLKFQEEKYRNIIANMNLGMIEVDNDEIIKFANQSFSDISGFELNEIINKKISDAFIFGENFEIINTTKGIRNQQETGIYQIPVKNKRGQLRWWAVNGAPNFDDKSNLVGQIGVFLDITAQKQLEIDLESEKIKAEEASKAKEAFLANMSHEIRTPLNAIIGFLRELEKQELTAIQKKHIDNSTIASKHLLSIINNILDISKIEAGEMSLNDDELIIEKSFQNVVTVLLPKAEQKGINININLSKKVAKVLKGDQLRIEQILFNLVGNSLKFTEKGKIDINCDLISENKFEQHIRISIIDTGIGMDKNYVNSIFKKFSQEDKKITRKFGGTGLGMSITKELIYLMSGTIEIESEKNIGTSIRIFLTLRKGNEKNIKTNHNTKPITTTLDNITILLVEDNEMNRMVAQNSLNYFNCKVTEATNGLEAVKILKTQKFDIILMDIQMPEMDGIEATEIIRKELKIETPIIALTANAFKTEIEKCYKIGMNDYVTKPFDETILLETIAKHMNNQEIQPEKTELIEKSYNLSALNTLSRGNSDFLQKMITIFINQTTDTILKVEEAIALNDFQGVSKLIHKIKPSIESIGIISIQEEVRNLEKIANETEDKDQIIKLFSVIKKVLELAVSQLKENELV